MFSDQLHRDVTIRQHPPKRIVSIVPSQTELLHTLGLEEEVVGITRFCVHPRQWFNTKTRVGGTKTLHLNRIAELAPDLIIGNKEENDRGQVEALAQQFPVWISDVYTLDDALDMIRQLGEVCGKSEIAARLSGQIQQGFEHLPPWPTLRVAYFIWRKPYMVAASGTFIDHMLGRAGFENVFAEKTRYPEVSAQDLAAKKPDLILLSSEPFPFSEKHVEAFCEICPQARTMIVDGEMFSWYGSRLLEVPVYFTHLRQKMA